MLTLTFERPGERVKKNFEGEVTLVPEEGPDGQLSLNHALPEGWRLPWSAWARLSLSVAEDGSLLAINETKDENICFKGNVLTSAYLMESDQLTVGPLKIGWAVAEAAHDPEMATFANAVMAEEVELTIEEEAEYRQMDVGELLAEAEALVAPQEPTVAVRAQRTVAKLRDRRWSRQRRTKLAVGGAIALFSLFLLIGILRFLT